MGVSSKEVGMKTGPRFTPGIPRTWGVPGLPDSGFRFEKEGGGGGGSGDDDEAAQLKKLGDWFEAQTSGLRGNRDTILEEKRDLEARFKALEEQWKDLDPETVRAILAKFENDEEGKLIKEGKWEEVIESRVENLKKDFAAKLEAATKKIDELTTALGGKDEMITVLKVDSQVRELGLAMDPPMDPKGLGDAIRAARTLFKLDKNNEPVALQDGNTPIIGKDGKTPLGIEEWLQNTFESGKTLWWGHSSGGGATGGGDGDRDKNLDKDAIEKMSPRQKLRVGYQDAV